MATEINKGRSPLRPRARIIKTIGEELISTESVAILELVKNSYDADAKKVEIIFDGTLTEGLGQIMIWDDGTGMSFDTVKKGWMEPATIIKKITKKSGNGRNVLGEKGIGRFASAKLARKMEMTTKIISDNEIYAKFNWEDFSNDDKYLDEIDCEWEIREPKTITNQGTMLLLEGLNTTWDKAKFHDLGIALSRLINPFDLVDDFEIILTLPEEFKEYSGKIQPPESLGNPDYKITGKVNARGELEYNYTIRKSEKLGSGKKEIIIKSEIVPARGPECGPFEFEFRVWDRERDNLKGLALTVGSTLKDIQKDLDEASGISVYRDKFRVLPYGEPKDDWLRLDFRRVQNPTMRLSNNQIIGYVEISLEKNPALVDQSNREGIVATSEFEDLKECIKVILNELEQKRYGERPREKDRKPETVEGIFSGFSMAPVFAMVEEKLPKDAGAKKLVVDAENSIKDSLKKVQEVLARYRRLSTLGLLLDVVLHDGNGILLRISNEMTLLEREFGKQTPGEEKLKSHLETIKKERQIMAQLFKRLEPFGGRKRGRPKDIVLEKAIGNVFALYHSKIDALKIAVSLPDGSTPVRFDEAELELIFVNLIENSLYWLDMPNRKNPEIVVELTKKHDELVIVFSDSGPGIPEENEEKIFEPYFTTRPDGIGLGLTIIGELVTEYDGTFELIKNGPLDGASFRVIFRRRI